MENEKKSRLCMRFKIMKEIKKANILKPIFKINFNINADTKDFLKSLYHNYITQAHIYQ